MRKKEFLGRVEAFLTSQGLSATRFGINACHDPAFVFRLRRGMETREEKKERVLAYMENFPNTRVKTNSMDTTADDWAAGEGLAGDWTGVEGLAGNKVREEKMAIGLVKNAPSGGVWTGVEGSAGNEAPEDQMAVGLVKNAPSGGVWTGVGNFACEEAAEDKINTGRVKNASGVGEGTGVNQPDGDEVGENQMAVGPVIYALAASTRAVGDWTTVDESEVERTSDEKKVDDNMAGKQTKAAGLVGERVVRNRTLNKIVGGDWTRVKKKVGEKEARGSIESERERPKKSQTKGWQVIGTGVEKFACDEAAKVISFPGADSVTDHALTKESGVADE